MVFLQLGILVLEERWFKDILITFGPEGKSLLLTSTDTELDHAITVPVDRSLK